MKRILVVPLVVFTLTACGVFGSDGKSSPEWRGNWRVTEDFSGETPNNETYWTYGEDHFRVVRDDSDSECDIFIYHILEVSGNDVTILIGSEPSTERLTVSTETLTSRIIRSNYPESEGETATATAVDDEPRKLLGCESGKAVTVEGGRPSLRKGR